MQIKSLLVLLLFLPVTVNCQKQASNFKKEFAIDESLEEVSGIEIVANSDLIWMVEDSGNEELIYGYSLTKNKIVREVKLNNSDNEDWEDLASDPEGNLYIGDFGNNDNERKDLCIYIISNNNLLSEEEVTPKRIEFSLEDQTKFPPNKKQQNFDVESFFVLNDFIYLFTRNRSSKFDGTTKCYRLANKPGKHQAKLISSYKTCNDDDDCQITSATINHATKTIALLSYNKLWLIDNYNGDNFFEGTIRRLNLGHTTQKESITFKDEKTLLIVDESKGNTNASLYSIKL